MAQRSLLPLIWNDEAVVAVDSALRTELSDIASDPEAFTTNDAGLWQGPLSIAPFYAEEIGCLAWTESVIELLGETFARRILGDRIVADANQGRYAYLINQAAGKPQALNLIAELRDANISHRVGVFTKPDADDKSTWTLNENVAATIIPTTTGLPSAFNVRGYFVPQVGANIGTLVGSLGNDNFLGIAVNRIAFAATETRTVQSVSLTDGNGNRSSYAMNATKNNRTSALGGFTSPWFFQVFSNQLPMTGDWRNVQVNFTNGDTVPADVVRPTGIDITISKLTASAVTTNEQEYLNEVIPRLIPFTLVDVRITVLFVQSTTIFYSPFGMNDAEYRFSNV